MLGIQGPVPLEAWKKAGGLSLEVVLLPETAAVGGSACAGWKDLCGPGESGEPPRKRPL